VISDIQSLRFYNAPADATDALKVAINQGFQAVNGGRPGERQVIIHIGAGTGADSRNYADNVKIALEKGIIVYNVAVGDGWIVNKLSEFAGQPETRYSLPVSNFPLLNAPVSNTLAYRVENEVPYTEDGLPVARSCLPRADIVILLDGSTSVTSNNFLTAKENVKYLASQLQIGPNRVHVALVQFSGKTSLEFPLTKYTDRLSVLRAIDRATYMHGNTETGLALKYARNEVFSSSMGARLDVPRIIILLTNGAATNHAQAVTEADLTRANGITIYAVGIGNKIDRLELQQITGDSSHVFTAVSYNDLETLVTPILNAACQARVSTPPPTTTPDPSKETCKDNIPTCDLYIQQNTDNGGFCAHYVTMAKENCTKSCGYCTTVIPTIPVTPPPCRDTISNCTSYSTADCVAFASFFSERCAQMCGLCDIKAETSGFHGMCMYKSKSYGQGEKWYDGCDYECTCIDAAHGKFECVSRCDVYHDLPSYCTLVQKEGECCLQPVCHFQSTTSTFSVTAHGTTTDGHDVCNYLGRQMAQDQLIEFGCTSQCVCLNATLGTVNCTAKCPVYDTMTFPSYCYLETVPGTCCQQPRCELPTTSAIFTGFGTVSEKAGYKEIYDESKQPPCIDLKPECPLYGKDTCQGNYKPFMTENCPVYCGLCHEKYPGFVAGPEDKCIYNGVQHSAGDVWEPDCEHQCTCDTEYYGFYRCWSKCPTYTQVPTGCKLEKLASDCCPHISCPVSTVLLPSTMNVKGPQAGSNIYIVTSTGQQKPLLPTLNPDGSVNTGTSAYQTTAVKGCLFNGRVLVEGEIAKDYSCGQTCQCVNENTGLMSCVSRCPTYSPANALCTSVTDPFDACCTVPSCPLSVTNPPKPSYLPPTYVYSVVKNPDPQQILAVTTVKTLIYTTGGTPTAGLATTPRTTYNPLHFNRPQSANPLPTMPPGVVPNPNAPGHCTHIETGLTYKEGERWTVDCKYNCLCVNASAGSYICTNMCVDLQCPIGANCTQYPDPDFPCCNLLQINLPSNIEIHPTSLSTGQTCMYNGKEHNIGQTWQEGCDRNCSCNSVNATMVSIQCKDLCPKYISLPPGCQEVKVEGSCCPILVGSTCTGQYCLDLNQNPHLPGESWREGCQYECTCTQKPEGFYRECRG
ncbi:cartilage matrix protein, partial [Biomphalaria pfeifferi]